MAGHGGYLKVINFPKQSDCFPITPIQFYVSYINKSQTIPELPRFSKILDIVNV